MNEAEIISPEAELLALLRTRGETVAAAESCTGGLIAKRITDLPGASAAFRGGVVVYTNEAKTALLGVAPETLDEYTAVSYPVAMDLAENVRERLGADYGLGVTGVAGPDTDGVHPVGTVFVSLAAPEECFVQPLELGDLPDRAAIRSAAADAAFGLLLRKLRGQTVI